MDELVDLRPGKTHELPCQVCSSEAAIGLPFPLPVPPIQRNHVIIDTTRAEDFVPGYVLLACSVCRTVKAVLRSELS